MNSRTTQDRALYAAAILALYVLYITGAFQ